MGCDGVDGCDQEEEEDEVEVDGGTRDLGEHSGC